MKKENEIPQWLKIALDIIPLTIFFFFIGRYGIYTATFAFIIVSLISLAINWYLVKKIPYILFFSVILIVIFGGFTLVFQDELFIKLKPTILNCAFAIILFIGLKMEKNLLALLLGDNIQLPMSVWNTLTKRWIVFFIIMACINEIVWRHFSTEFWAGFKLFGFMPLTILFISTQIPLIMSYQKDHTENEKPDDTK